MESLTQSGLKKIKGTNWHLCLKNPEVGCTSGEGWFSSWVLFSISPRPPPKALPSPHHAWLLTVHRDEHSFSEIILDPHRLIPPNPPAIEASSLWIVLTFSLHPSSRFYFWALFMWIPSFSPFLKIITFSDCKCDACSLSKFIHPQKVWRRKLKSSQHLSPRNNHCWHDG